VCAETVVTVPQDERREPFLEIHSRLVEDREWAKGLIAGDPRGR